MSLIQLTTHSGLHFCDSSQPSQPDVPATGLWNSTIGIDFRTLLTHILLLQLSFLFVCLFFNKPCLTLCDPMDCSPPGSTVHGIFQAIILEWVAISSSRRYSWPRDQTHVSYIGKQILYHWATWEDLDSKYSVLKKTKINVLVLTSDHTITSWTWQGNLFLDNSIGKNVGPNFKPKSDWATEHTHTLPPFNFSPLVLLLNLCRCMQT